jgi:hypothetical protein
MSDIVGFDALIKVFQIFRKYGNLPYPTHCEHDEMMVCVDPETVSDEDKQELDSLGFFVDEDDNCFKSFRYGSA